MVKLLNRKRASSGAVIPVIPVTENNASNRHVGAHPAIPRIIRLLSIPILLFWIALLSLIHISEPTRPY